jgi:plasmid stability protein
MPDVLIRDLDPNVLEQLKASAREHGRSLQAEIHEVLRDAATFGAAGTRELAASWQRRLSGKRFSDSAQLIRRDRAER